MRFWQHPWTDSQIDTIIGNLLRWGIVIAAVVVMMGGAVFLARYGFEAPGYRVFHGEPTDLCTISGIFTDVRALRARGIIQLGMLLLIGTPIARVAFAILAFALQRDRTYVFVTLIVFGVLLFGLLGGGR